VVAPFAVAIEHDPVPARPESHDWNRAVDRVRGSETGEYPDLHRVQLAEGAPALSTRNRRDAPLRRTSVKRPWTFRRGAERYFPA